MPNYQDISEKELKIGYWFVSHKILLKRILIAFLILLSLNFYSYSIYYLTSDILNMSQREEMLNSLTSEIVNYQSYQAAHKPADLGVAKVLVFPLGKNRYDLMAEINNPNDKWVVKSFSYHFLLDGQATPERFGFIYPNEDKYIFDLGYASNSSVSSANVVIEKISWGRYVDFATYYGERYNFDIKDIKFYPAGSPEAGGAATSKATFSVTNKSAYNFWSVGFQVLLWRGGEIAAANYITLDMVLSGKERRADVFWFEPLSGITKVQIIPEVDILNPSVYMPI